jgi:hypothetical protein
MSERRVLFLRQWKPSECAWPVAESVATWVDRATVEWYREFALGAPDTHDEWRRLNEEGEE